MCSLAVILRGASRYPLIAAANRDESRVRASLAPFLWSTSPRILAGRDESRGGTWMGVNEHGLFAGVTNLRAPNLPDRASRGQLVLRVLACRDINEASRELSHEDPGATNPFLLVCANREGEAFWTSSAHDLTAMSLPPGVHAFGNLLPGDPRHRKADGALRRIEEAWASRTGDGPDDVITTLTGALREHVDGGDPEVSLCAHTTGDYGTVSSSLLLAGTDPASCRFLYAGGPPCVTPYQDLSAALRELWPLPGN
jgi:uncharacterized protein with NRDE domain